MLQPFCTFLKRVRPFKEENKAYVIVALNQRPLDYDPPDEKTLGLSKTLISTELPARAPRTRQQFLKASVTNFYWNQSLLILMATTLKKWISYPMIISPKCSFRVLSFFKLIVYNFQNKLKPPKRILALLTWSQNCLVSELQPFWIR